MLCIAKSVDAVFHLCELGFDNETGKKTRPMLWDGKWNKGCKEEKRPYKDYESAVEYYEKKEKEGCN